MNNTAHTYEMAQIANLTKIASYNATTKNGIVTFQSRVDNYYNNEFLSTQVYIQTVRDFRCEAIRDAQDCIKRIETAAQPARAV